MLKELDLQYADYVGIDEAGRGNLAGSLVFCGAKLKEGKTIEDIAFAHDSKSMTKKKREELYEQVIEVVDYYTVFIYPAYIDEHGLSAAHTECLEQIKYNLKNPKYLYDGKANYKVQGIETLVKADAKVSIVAAASIIAKVSKDREMKEQAKLYPEFDFENNAGYGTAKHIESIKEHGYTPLHRRSFNVKALDGLTIKEYKNDII